MDRFVNAIRGYAASQDRKIGQPRFGTVTSFDPDTYAAKVKLQPEDVLTGWLPIATMKMGSGWGLAIPPSVGDIVLVIPQEGHASHGVIVGALWNDQALVPNSGSTNPPPPQSGEFWFVHQTGTSIKITNHGTTDADIAITGSPNGNMNVTLNGTGALALAVGNSGKVTVTAPHIEIGASGATLHELMNKTAMDVYNAHTHSGGPVPDQQMTVGTHTTSALKAA